MTDERHRPLLDGIAEDIESFPYVIGSLPLPAEPDDSVVPALAHWLDDADRRRVAEMSSARTGIAFVLTRALLRRVLGRIVGRPPHEIEFAATERGKPALIADSDEPLHFNVSHSRTHAMIGLSRIGDVGVDVEDVGHYRDAVARRSTSDDEYAMLRALSDAERPAAFYRLWTIKEACAKATGHGIGVGMDNVTATLDDNGRWREFVWASIDLGAGLAAAIALRADPTDEPPMVGAVHRVTVDWLVTGRR